MMISFSWSQFRIRKIQKQQLGDILRRTIAIFLVVTIPATTLPAEFHFPDTVRQPLFSSTGLQTSPYAVVPNAGSTNNQLDLNAPTPKRENSSVPTRSKLIPELGNLPLRAAVPPPPAPTNIALVQHASHDNGGGSLDRWSSVTVVLPNVHAGNLLTCGITSGTNGGTALTVSDDVNGSWSVASAAHYGGSILIQTTGVFYYPNSGAGDTTITGTIVTPGQYVAMNCQEWSGVALTNPLDVQTQQDGSTANPTSGSVTPSADGELILGTLVWQNAFPAFHDSNFTLTDDSPTACIDSEYLIQTSAAPIAGTWTSSPQVWTAGVAAFKPSSGAPSDLPVANAGPAQTVSVNASVQLDGTKSTDPLGQPLTYQWQFTSKPASSAAAISNATTSRPTFTADVAGTYKLHLIVSNGTQSSSPATVTISTTNSSPVASAGPGQTVTTGASVILDGRASTDVDGDRLTYAWTIVSKPSGSTATLSNATQVSSSFTADLAGSYTLQLVVNDSHTSSVPSQVVVTTANTPPVANAGPNRLVSTGSTVQLDGSKSTDVNGDLLTYSWAILSKPSSSSALLSSASAINPTFVADVAGLYVIQLVASDASSSSVPATVVIETDNVPPIANPGPDQTKATGNLVTLDGTASSAVSGRTITYKWALLKRPTGSSVALASKTTAHPTFTPDVAGTYVVQLIVNDGFLSSAPKTVVISTVHSRPVANAGPSQNVTSGSSVTLDGSASSSVDGASLTYTWSLLAEPVGAASTISNIHAVGPTFGATVGGIYVAQLIVNDGTLDSFPSTVEINFTAPQPPIVSAGSNQTIALPTDTVTLQGNITPGTPGSTPTGLWTKVSGPGTVTFVDATSPTTSASFSSAGVYVLKLTATDGSLAANATVTITVLNANAPPVVTVGPNQTITYPANSANLTGSVTDDGNPIGNTLTKTWSKVAGPGAANFANANQENTQVTFSVPGNYILRLSGYDGQYTSSASLTVAYAAPSMGSISVNAGPDQVLVFPDSANLTGTATDGNPPPGSTLSYSWSVVQGPGTVTFSASTALNTSVTASAPGVYFLRLTASNGIFSASSDVKIYFGNTQCTASNKGTDFWLMFTGANYQQPPADGFTRQLSFFISGDFPTTGTVTASGADFTASFTVTPGQITTVNLPQTAQVTSSDLIESLGIHITAQNPIAVYGLNFISFETDGYLALPTNTLGTSYIIASYTIAGTEFGITATQDDTAVTILPTADGGPFDPSHPYGSREANRPFTIHLNQGQTYQLRTDFTNAILGSGGVPQDFTGTVITSDKPIAVFGAHNGAGVPAAMLHFNSLVEQLLPTNLWGQNFVTMPLAQELHGDFFRFIAQADDTHLQINRAEAAVLQKGQFYEQNIAKPAEISANHPILTMQYSASDSFGSALVDPTMIVVPPFEQFGDNYTVNTPPTSEFPTGFINVLAPTAAVLSNSVLLDGTAIAASSFQVIGQTPFSGAQVAVTEGAHTVSAGLPFGLFVYGFNITDAYGYSGGVCLARGVPNSTVVASPKTASNPKTSQVCVHATVKDTSNNPIGGTGLTFAVTGVNPQTGTGITDSNGEASFCYNGLNSGSDLVTITAGAASDTASLTWTSSGPNQPPIVSAGPNLTVSAAPSIVALQGNATDDGLPTGGSLTLTWSKLSGPGSVSFGTPAQPVTTATFSQAGTYVLQLLADDTALQTNSTVTVSVLAADQAPSVDAGSDQTFLWTVPNQQPVHLQGTVSDADHLPVGSSVTMTWTLLSGPAPVTFAPSANVANPTTTFANPGNYTFRLTASDTQLSSSATVTIHALSVGGSLPASQTTIVGTPVNLVSTVDVAGQPYTAGDGVVLQWTPSTDANVNFSSPTALTTNVTFASDNGGSPYQLALHVIDANNPAYEKSICCTNITVLASNPTTPVVGLSGSLDGSTISTPVSVTGSVDSGSWKLEYALKDDLNPMMFTTLNSGTSAVSGGALGTFDPTLLLNGIYVLRLTSTNAAGTFASSSVSVNVTGNAKVGVFSLSFNDLTVPVAGIPLQVIRSYDSRDKGVGDFGIGWRLSLANIRLQKNTTLGSSWQETQALGGFTPQYCLAAAQSKLITVTFPDGRVFKFQAGGLQQCQAIEQITTGSVSFVELAGPANTAGATLTVADGGQFVVNGDVPGPVTLTGFDGLTYDPTLFILRTADGARYTIDQKLGLSSVTDTNGNTLTLTPGGISSSAGKSVPFARDDQGRIVRITDPNLGSVTYRYSPEGDLAGTTDRASNNTAYTYDAKHDLTGILTPDGKQILTNTFDNSGRLTTTQDGQNQSVTFTHDIGGRSETTQDRNGNNTTYVYDDNGNVTSITDALGHTTTSTYDSATNNKLSETNALGKTTTFEYDVNGNVTKTTDPLMHAVSALYNGLNKPLTITDANGHVTTNEYDTGGNLKKTTDSLGNVTTNTYTQHGQLLTTTDALNHMTSFGYDGVGNLTSQIDALGAQTTYAYDNNGNRTSQSVTRTLPGGSPQTLTTTYTYDGVGRLTKTTYPDLTTTQTSYNELGQQATTTDALGHITSYKYDSDGRLILTTYPDATTETAVYDNNGNRTHFTDRKGLLTVYTYDALNRLTQSKENGNPGSNQTSYDFIGQVLTSTDPLGNVTTYAYDDVGRRATVTDAMSHVTTFGYDAAGNQTTAQDANNHTTTYVYDSDNRRTQITYPDSKFETTAYDALGRVTDRTDANGKSTQYGYDAAGRLTSVTDALNHVTSYTYDEVGNRLTQVDAKSQTTSYQYDQRGRRTQRKLPLGQTETYTYDSAGNLHTKTDFNGKTTTYAYDVANRLLSKTPDASFSASPITYTYESNTGLRSTMTDPSGVTGYGYNPDGTLQHKNTPEGLITYNYDNAKNLTTLSGGFNVNYTYDALNRLSTVVEANTGTTTYGYDAVGNLATVTYPNGVVHTYTYDNRNRLNNLAVDQSSTHLASYAYALDFAGHRTGVTELNGRTVTYGCDNIYRLTSETIASDPASVNGALGYTYDNVGNRTALTSTVTPVPAATWSYDANDRFAAGDSYDNNGNTTASGGISDVYDFENHLIQQGGVTIVYDGDGNRVSKTVAGVTTKYLVDDVNPTGYAQVLAETGLLNFTTQHVYGLEHISIREYFTAPTNDFKTFYYVYDGHGSVRALADGTGTVTDTYDYDAFGVLIHSTGSTPNNYLYSGEQYDPDLHLYYNRARYLNVSTGRFWTMDNLDADPSSPPSIHKYLYTANEPVGHVDPTGNDFSLVSFSVNIAISATIDAVAGYRANGIKGAAEGALKGAAIGAVFFAFGAVVSGGGKLFQFARASTAAGAVALDTNVLIAALEGGELQAVEAALAGRVPVISITVAKEFLLKGDVQVLREFLIAHGGSIGTAATAAEITALQSQATLLGRVLAAADASVAASAIKDAIPLLTRDTRLINFLIAVGQAVETF